MSVSREENRTGETGVVETVLDSGLESADEAENLALEAARQLGFSEEDLHKIGMAVREAVVNAVVHGNRYNARKKVRLQIAGDEDRLTVMVSDEGQGFELEALPDPVAASNILQQSGRGIYLIRAFMDEFEVRRLAPAGTEVKLVKYTRHKRGG